MKPSSGSVAEAKRARQADESEVAVEADEASPLSSEGRRGANARSPHEQEARGRSSKPSIARQEEQKADSRQAGGRIRSVHRPDRPREREDQRERLRLCAATARCEQAGTAQLGMGPADAFVQAWTRPNYKRRAGRCGRLLAGRQVVRLGRRGRQAHRPRCANRRECDSKCRTVSTCSRSRIRRMASKSPPAAATRRFKFSMRRPAACSTRSRATPTACSACDSRPMASNCSAARSTTRPACGISPPALNCRRSRAIAGGSGRPSSRRMASRIVTAGQDGKAIVWADRSGAIGPSRRRDGQDIRHHPGPQPLYTQLTEFTGHDGAVYSAASRPTASSSPPAVTTSS